MIDFVALMHKHDGFKNLQSICTFILLQYKFDMLGTSIELQKIIICKIFDKELLIFFAVYSHQEDCDKIEDCQLVPFQKNLIALRKHFWKESSELIFLLFFYVL